MKHIPTSPEESFEETGAGDTTIARLALAIHDNSLDSIVNAIHLGNHAAGITIKNIGREAKMSYSDLHEHGIYTK